MGRGARTKGIVCAIPSTPQPVSSKVTLSDRAAGSPDAGASWWRAAGPGRDKHTIRDLGIGALDLIWIQLDSVGAQTPYSS